MALNENIPGATQPDADVYAEANAAQTSRRKRSAKNNEGAGIAKPKPMTQQRLTKADKILKRLKTPKGATIEQLMEATGWQAHSVRGFLAGTVKKKLGLTLASETGKDGARRYHIDDRAAAE